MAEKKPGFKIKWWWGDDAENEKKENPEFAAKAEEAKKEAADALGKPVEDLEKPTRKDERKIKQLADEGKIDVGKLAVEENRGKSSDAAGSENKGKKEEGGNWFNWGGGSQKDKTQSQMKEKKEVASKGNKTGEKEQSNNQKTPQEPTNKGTVNDTKKDDTWFNWGSKKKDDKRKEKPPGESVKENSPPDANKNNEGNEKWFNWGSKKDTKGDNSKDGSKERAQNDTKVPQSDNKEKTPQNKERDKTTQKDKTQEKNNNSWFNWGGKPKEKNEVEGGQGGAGQKEVGNSNSKDPKEQQSTKSESKRSENKDDLKGASASSGKDNLRDKKGSETVRRHEEKDVVTSSDKKRDNEKAQDNNLDSRQDLKVSQKQSKLEEKPTDNKTKGTKKTTEPQKAGKAETPNKDKESANNDYKKGGDKKDQKSDGKREDKSDSMIDDKTAKKNNERKITNKQDDKAGNRNNDKQERKASEQKSYKNMLLIFGLINLFLIAITLVLTEVVFDASVRHNFVALCFLVIGILPFIILGWHKSSASYIIGIASVILVILTLCYLLFKRTTVSFYFVKLDDDDSVIDSITDMKKDKRMALLESINTSYGIPIRDILLTLKTIKGVKVVLLDYPIEKTVGEKQFSQAKDKLFIQSNLVISKDENSPIIPPVYNSRWGDIDEARALKDIGEIMFSHFSPNYIAIYGLFNTEKLGTKLLNRSVSEVEIPSKIT